MDRRDFFKTVAITGAAMTIPVSYTHLRAHESRGLGDVYKRQ